MRTAVLAWRYLWSRPLATALNLLLLTLGLTLVGFVLQAREQVERAFERDLAGIDAVVGAKGSPLQLILSGVFHIDVPPGNILLADLARVREHPLVAQVVPLSLGDSFGGFRIVGTTPDYLTHYRATVAQGRPWDRPMEAVLGHTVARASGLAPGQRFEGAHGLGGGGTPHGEHPYTVSGVLAPCGCVLDRLVLTATESVWQVHDEMHGGAALDAEERRALEAEREVTLALVKYRSPLAAVTFPRWVRSDTPLQAAAPAIEITRLLSLLGVGSRVLQALGGVVLASAGLGVFVALWNAVRERRADLAMLRMLGAPARRLAAVVAAEALWLAALGGMLAVALSHLLMAGVGHLLAQERSLALAATGPTLIDAVVLALALGVALLAAALPVLHASRVDVFALLQPR
jgi:putative ABC transport system permease protein